MAIKFKSSLNSKNLDLKQLGDILNQNWKIKQKFTKNISSNYLNTIYKKAISNGCYGGKLLGAGGGGFFIFICKKKLHKRIIDKIHNCRHVNFKFYNQGTKKCYLD